MLGKSAIWTKVVIWNISKDQMWTSAAPAGPTATMCIEKKFTFCRPSETNLDFLQSLQDQLPPSYAPASPNGIFCNPCKTDCELLQHLQDHLWLSATTAKQTTHSAAASIQTVTFRTHCKIDWDIPQPMQNQLQPSSVPERYNFTLYSPCKTNCDLLQQLRTKMTYFSICKKNCNLLRPLHNQLWHWTAAATHISTFLNH